MTKRKKNKSNRQSNLRKLKTEIEAFSKVTGHSHTDLEHEPVKQTRKQKRKEARLQKKSRRNAYCRRIPLPSKDEKEKAKLDAIKKQKLEIKQKKQEEKKKKMKARAERKEMEEKEFQLQQKRVADMWDDKEIKDLEKKLGLNKRKKKDTLPMSFQNDGLSYILDVIDKDKLEAMASLEEETEEDSFALMEGDSEDDNESDFSEDDKEEEMDEEEEGFDEQKSSEEDHTIVVKQNESKKKGDKAVVAVQMQGDGRRDTEGDRKLEEIRKGERQGEKGKEKWEELADRIKAIAEKRKLEKKVRFSEEVGVDIPEGDDDGDLNSDEDEDTKRTDEEEEDVDDEQGEEDYSEDEEYSEDDGDEGSDSDFEDDEDLDSDEPECIQTTSKTKEIRDKGLKEDIYGRLIDSQGNIIKDNKPAGGEGAYIPPAKRLQVAGQADGAKKFQLERLQKQLKGLVNRASENNMQPISSQIEELYLSNSRADVNETLVSLISDACITPVLTPDRLSMELMMLVAILHGNVGSEVGAVFLQSLAKQFSTWTCGSGDTKEIDNILVLIANLYNFKVVHSTLIFDILKILTDSFTEKDVELILLLLRHVGFSLRKDSPAELKEFIVKVQNRAGSADAASLTDQSRVRFMLEVIMAIRNNNMRKIPNYDPEHLEHLRKLIRGYIRGGQFGDNQLHISLEDLLNAEEKGKWWLVGSAWDGKSPDQHKSGLEKSSSSLGQLEVSSKLQELARKQRMNTDLRRNIFFIIMTSEDYLDSFEKLLRMSLKSSQQNEIVLVILDCCLQEKNFNPFYAYLSQKFCEHHRTYQMAFQFCIWDRFKEVSSLSDTNRHNLGKLLSHLFITKALSLSILKVISFGTLEKPMVRLLKQVMLEILTEHSQTEVEAIFTRIAQLDKLKQLHEGLRLFLRHFLIGKKSEVKNAELAERVEMVDRLLSRGKSHVLL